MFESVFSLQLSNVLVLLMMVGRSLLYHVFSKDIFVTILEFEKLERLEFGGTKGAILNGQIHEMTEEFMELCEVFKQSTYDPSDYSNMVMLYLWIFIS